MEQDGPLGSYGSWPVAGNPVSESILITWGVKPTTRI